MKYYCKKCRIKTSHRTCPICQAVLTISGRSCDKCDIYTYGIAGPGGERLCPICNGIINLVRRE